MALWAGIDLIYTSVMELMTTYYTSVPRLGVDAAYWLVANVMLLNLRAMSNQFGNLPSVITNQDEISEDDDESQEFYPET